MPGLKVLSFGGGSGFAGFLSAATATVAIIISEINWRNNRRASRLYDAPFHTLDSTEIDNFQRWLYLYKPDVI